MTSFVSTRGSGPATLADALFRGLAPDGGLYVPTSLGRLGAPPPGLESFADTARWAGPVVIPELSASLVREVVTDALDFPTPLVEIEPDLHVLELFHGPTHAFKDVGARFMARLMAAIDPGGGTRTVLVATSGDTGSAVAHAFHDIAGYRVVVLFPKEGVSERQRRLMSTLGGNVLALAVDGVFDDCQRMVKGAFRSEELRERHRLTSANSINVGRLLPQSLYYVHAAARLGWSDRPPYFVVPSGNLGNLSGGLLGLHMGMPTSGFLAAMNANRMFADFLDDAGAEPRPSIPTYSNAMDVGDPSNLERIRWLYRDDPDRLRRDVRGVSVGDADTRSCITDVYERTGYVLDPHTAVGYEALSRTDAPADRARVILATAHPAKFPDIVEEAIGSPVPLPPGIEAVMQADEHTVDIAADLGSLASVLDG